MIWRKVNEGEEEKHLGGDDEDGGARIMSRSWEEQEGALEKTKKVLKKTASVRDEQEIK